MDRLSRTDAIESIRTLKARYFRLLDTKRWDELATLFTADLQVAAPDGTIFVDSGSRYAAVLRQALGDAVSFHQGLTAEIEITGADTARAIWAMKDTITWLDDDAAAGRRSLVGTGHYHETYRCEGGTWRIATMTLTRITLDEM